MKSSVWFVALSFLFSAGRAIAQEGQAAAPVPESYRGPVSAIAAIVNDKVITTFDVQQRMKMMILSSGRQIPASLLPQVQDQAVRDLVNEQLKLAEAERFEMKIEESDIDAEIKTMAAQGGITVAEMERQLASDGIMISALKEQIKATIAWQQLVQGRFRSRVRVDDEEIERTLSRMRDNVTKEQYLVSEICIPMGDPSQAQQTYEGSLQLIEQIRRGVPFSVVAQQFSACPSAANGGDLSWVRSGELAPELDQVLQMMEPGSVTNPIPSEGAFMIISLRDKRLPAVAGEETFELAYASAPLSIGRTEALLALERLKTADACGNRKLRQDLGPGVGVAKLENVRLPDIDERFRSAIEDLNRGDLSAAVEADDALHIVYVCEKDEGLGLPSRARVEEDAFVRELSRIGQQYLRDLERKSMVDIRLRAQAPPNG
jgi:peptidyl-prolyl cis-trans isomerase SurA